MKRFTALLLSLVLLFQVVGCHKGSGLLKGKKGSESSTEIAVIDEEDMKIGFLFPLGADAPDTISHVQAIRKMQRDTGLTDSQVLIVKNVDADAYETEIEKLVSKGCDLIFAKSRSAEDAMIAAAQNHPEVEFCQEDGKEVLKNELTNVHCFYARLFEGYYAAGVAAGMKLNDLLNRGRITPDTCVVGFAASNKNPENISCVNAFRLGINSVCSQASMKVRYVGKAGNYDKDDECARQLVASGVRLMGQRVFTTAVASVCAEYNVPLVGNEINLIDVAPKDAITSVVVDWSLYYEYAVKCLLEGKEIDKDWVAGYEENAVSLSQFNDAHIKQEALDEVADVESDLRKDNCKVFDLEKFTVEGANLEELAKTNKGDKKYKAHISKGEFRESRKKSVPIMDFLIDAVYESTDDFLGDETESTEEDS